jgi:TPP-dependent pyruvate/acetoin dehydrogenase alpha subunit
VVVTDENVQSTLTDFYARMFLIREFERDCQALYEKGLLHGTTHLCIGQEAVAVGAAAALGEGDRVACTYRGHGHALALGVDPGRLYAELLGRGSGVCGGRAGSMNVIDLEHRLIGCFGIVGGSIGAATGAAMALKRQGGVAVAFFGDGAVNQAYFHECLNFAAVLNLPVLYVCENNLYAEFTPIEAGMSGTILDRVAAFRIGGEQVDGNDVLAVHSAVSRLLSDVRTTSTPRFLEALTYRQSGHSKSDPGRYRKPGELERWRERDPLVLAGRHLTELGTPDKSLEDLRQGVTEQLRAARDWALDSPFPVAGQASEFKPGVGSMDQ